MHNDFYRQVFEQSPIGYAYVKIINRDSAPNDLEIIEFNQAFETFTGIRDQNDQVFRGSDIIPEFSPELLGKWLIRDDGEGAKPDYFVHNGRNLKISLIQHDAGFCTLMMEDVTDQALIPEKYLPEIAGSLEDVFFLCDRNRFLYISPAFEKLWGISRKLVYNDPLLFLSGIDSEDRATMSDIFQKDASGKFYSDEFRLHTSDGSKWLWIRLFPVTEGSSRRAGVIVDISSIKMIEEALKESEQQLVLAQKLSQTGNWLKYAGSRKFIFSDEARRIFGFHQGNSEVPLTKIKEVIGKNARRTLIRAAARGVLEKRPFEAVVNISTTSGASRFVALRGKPFYGEDGSYTYIFGTVQDITEMRLYEDRLRLAKNQAQAAARLIEENEKKYQMLFGSMMNGFALCDCCSGQDGKVYDFLFLDINPAFERITGLKSADVIGKNALKVLPGLDEEWMATFSKVCATGEPVHFTNYVRPLDLYFDLYVFSPEIGKVAFVFSDITESQKMADSLYEEKERLEITLQSIGDAVICTDRNGRVERMNTAAESITGWKNTEAVGLMLDEVFNIFNVLTGQKCPTPVEKVIHEGTVVTLSSRTALHPKQGGTRFIADSAAPIISKSGGIMGAVLVFRDITDEKRHFDEINYMSSHDSLTGLYNRSFLDREMKRLDQSGVLPISIIMGDINGLKMVNDVFGHVQGDHLLKVISEILRGSVRKCDIVARSGGDEFVIILPQADSKTASLICERIYRACRKYPEQAANDRYTYPGISLGYSTKETEAVTLNDTLKTGENFMYRRKIVESRHTHSTIISSMRKSLSENTCENDQHVNCLRRLCREIADEMKLNEKDRSDLDVFVMLHDIGKITNNQSENQKRDELTDRENDQVRTHPETGFRIANSAPELAHISEYILTHHERWNGSGYPQGLKGTEIPLLSRIFAVADVYLSLTNGNAVRKPVGREEAAEKIKADAGVLFDPEVVKVFERIIQKQ